MTKSEEICKLLGICWHREFAGACKDCGELVARDGSDNPDFSNDAGRVQLLRLMRSRANWLEFKYYMLQKINDDLTDFLDDYLFTNGPMVEAVLEWLRKEKKCLQENN